VNRQRLPSKAFLKRLVPFRFGARIFFRCRGKASPRKVWLPAQYRPASSSRGGGVLERTTHCSLAPTQGR